jgi:uncharacterized protein
VTHENPDDDRIRALLETARRIAVVGLSPKPHRDSNRVARYLLERGYTVIPVYPREQTILGQRVCRRIQDIPEGVDLVDVFRRSEALPDVVEDAIAAKAPALWFQLDCVHEVAAARAVAAGMTVVMDRCILIDHGSLLGRGWRADG